MKKALAAALVTLTVLTGCTPAATPSTGTGGTTIQQTTTLDAKAFADLVARPGTVVLDVRTPAEFAAGHLAGAINIDLQSSDFAQKVGALDKDATYAVYCRSGSRSATALAEMQRQGFTKVQHLGGGIGAWQSAGQPVVRYV